jgi:hypothetical protein
MNILFTWQYRKESLYVDCTLTKNNFNNYDTRVTIKGDKSGNSLFHFEILNILGDQEYRIFLGSPVITLLKDIKEVILEQFDIIRPCHLN